MTDFNGKIKREHLTRKAFLYIRQSTLRQVRENTESTMRQYALKEKLAAMGWDANLIEVIDSDLGQSGANSEARRGFQYLVSEVSMGRAGVIAGIEVSRLSRSSADWNRLLQIAAISDTIIMDEDGVYNVNDFNDRLLLGLKGTLSEAELHYLQARMRGGLLNKAKRGELRRGVAIGYICGEDGQIVKDPDAQVQEAIAMFFKNFKRYGTAVNLVREYGKQGLLFPHRPYKGLRADELTWKPLTLANALHTLKNPIYAGIYAYGVTQIQHTVSGKKKAIMPKERYHAWLTESHPAYISEDQFNENNLCLARNARPRPEDEHGGAVREGCALLQGIAICGKCGRKMSLRYNTSSRTTQPVYRCEYDAHHSGGPVCQYVIGGNIDRAVEALLLEVINPMTIDAAIAIRREMTARKDEILKLYGQQLERARYEMELSKRRYLRVDPDNRLVAAELERDWNQKVIEYESAKAAYEQKGEAEIRLVDDKLRLALEQLVTDFPKIWSDPQASSKEKKRLVRQVIEDVTITDKSDSIILGIRFNGGATKTLEIPRTSQSLIAIKAEDELVAEIKEMIPLGLKYGDIVERLREKGLTVGFSGKPINCGTISHLVKKYGLPTKQELYCSEEGGWITTEEKMAELGVSRSVLKSMRKKGKVVYKHHNLRNVAYLYRPEGYIDA